MSLPALLVLVAVALIFFVLPWYLTWCLVRRRRASRRWLLTMLTGPVMGLAVAYAFVPRRQEKADGGRVHVDSA